MFVIKLLSLSFFVSILAACGAVESSTSATDSPPFIQLNGDAEVFISMGAKYDDEGATSLDAKDGALQVTITTTEPVMDALGSYYYDITYLSTDSDNNTSIATRKVIMVDDISPAM